jgi:Leucine-rich repeat (LRR) protein
VKSLKYLSLDGNNITIVPDSIGDLNQLVEFNLHNNRRIEAIPKSIGKIINLEILDIRNNNISSLPNAVKNLKRLKYIYLENNPICSNGWMTAAENIGFVDKIESLPDNGGSESHPHLWQR